MPYRTVDTNARTLSQQSTQQQVLCRLPCRQSMPIATVTHEPHWGMQADPTARPARNAAAFEAQADRTLAPGQTAQSVRAGFALPCNRNTRAQVRS